jgi:hypothetical protein
VTKKSLLPIAPSLGWRLIYKPAVTPNQKLTDAVKCRLWIALFFCLQFAAFSQPVHTQLLRGHVPAAVAKLKPSGQLEPEQELHLAIGLPLRNQEVLTNLLQRI